MAKDEATNIHIFYKTKSVRVTPSAGVFGNTVDIHIRLNPDGTVQDKFDAKNVSKGDSKSALGKKNDGTYFKVIDQSTIARVSHPKNYTVTMTVKVDGKNCTASVTRILDPGEKLFDVYSQLSKQREGYRSIENEYTTCVIE